jgi:hypothetical protein
MKLSEVEELFEDSDKNKQSIFNIKDEPTN